MPNVGKSTLFNALTQKGVPAENYPFTTIDPSVGVVAVPDPFEARRIVGAARALKPTLKILVRAHNEEERDYFITQNVDLTTTGPRAIGQMMAHYLNDMRLKKTN